MFYLFRSAWKYAGKDKWKLFVSYVLHMISFGGELLQPLAFGMAVNALQKNGLENLEPAVSWFGLYLAGFFIFQLFHHTGRYFECTTALKNQQRIVSIVYDTLCKLPMRWHVDHHSGEIVNRIKVAGDALRDFCFRQSNFLGYLVLSIGPIIVLADLNYKITMICIVLIGINLFIAFRMNRAIQPILNLQNESYHAFAAKLSDFACNIRTVIMLGLGMQTEKELKRKHDEYYRQNMREFRINQPRCFIIAFGAIITELVVITFYIWSCKTSKTAFFIGNLVMIITYFRQIEGAVFEITDSFFDTMHWKAAIQSVDVILNAGQMQKTTSFSETLPSWSSLLVKDLSFKYDNERFEIGNIDIELGRHSKIAVVGTSGSGKSTILQLFAGLYDPIGVKLFVDGTEHTNFNGIAGSIALIPQDSELFENTILYNITFGLEPDMVELEKAIDAARLREVIERLPNGIHTDIREKGVNLSGGERQRLALARGLYFSREKSILLLDEVTSSVDAINERLIMRRILDNNRDKCIVCSIHRLHLLDMFNTVLVMDKGCIVQRGSFAELANSEGYFKTLWDKYQVDDMKE